MTFSKVDENNGSNIKTWTWIHLTIIILVLFNSFFGSILLMRNGYLVQANNILLERLVSKYSLYETAPILVEQQSQKLIDIQACPPCPTSEPPTPVFPNRDPVSVLHVEVGKSAVYEFIYNCINPPTHTSTLLIEEYPGTWEGKGSSKIKAKQQAAFRAIKQHFPHLEAGLIYEDELYNPICNNKNPTSRIQ